MTGTGGGRRRGSGGGGRVAAIEPSCGDINFETVLNSPVQQVLSQLRKGDCLKVELRTSDKRRTVIASRSGQPAGSITSSDLQRLIECLGKGMTFRAIVLEVTQGLCRVQVLPGGCN